MLLKNQGKYTVTIKLRTIYNCLIFNILVKNRKVRNRDVIFYNLHSFDNITFLNLTNSGVPNPAGLHLWCQLPYLI